MTESLYGCHCLFVFCRITEWPNLHSAPLSLPMTVTNTIALHYRHKYPDPVYLRSLDARCNPVTPDHWPRLAIFIATALKTLKISID